MNNKKAESKKDDVIEVEDARPEYMKKKGACSLYYRNCIFNLRDILRNPCRVLQITRRCLYRGSYNNSGSKGVRAGNKAQY